MVVSASATFHKAGRAPAGALAAAGAPHKAASPASAPKALPNHVRFIETAFLDPSCPMRQSVATLCCTCESRPSLGREPAELPAPDPHAPRLLEPPGLRHPPAL